MKPYINIDSRGVTGYRRLVGILVPRPKILTQFDGHTHFKILQEVPHPNPNIFLLNLDELEHLFRWAVGGLEGSPPSPLRESATDWLP